MYLMTFSSHFWSLLCSICLCSAQQINITEKSYDIPNFGLLDIRVGKILQVEKHSNADSLYVETVDFGDLEPKIVVSSLVRYFNWTDLLDKLALFVVNLKPTKLRGVRSQGMIMCVHGGENVELLIPPEDSKPGDVVLVEGYDYKPEPKISPKIYDRIEPHLKVNDDRVVTFNNIPWNVSGKGFVTTTTIKNVSFIFKPTTRSFNNSTTTPATNITTFQNNTIFYVSENPKN